jgi:hypothetical protein
MADPKFQKLRMAFTEAPIHQQFHPPMANILHTEAKGFSIDSNLNHNNTFGIHIRVKFWM